MARQVPDRGLDLHDPVDRPRRPRAGENDAWSSTSIRHWTPPRGVAGSLPALGVVHHYRLGLKSRAISPWHAFSESISATTPARRADPQRPAQDRGGALRRDPADRGAGHARAGCRSWPRPARTCCARCRRRPTRSSQRLRGEQTSLRVLELPLAARKRIAEVLPFELEALLPYEPREAVIDYQPIDSDADHAARAGRRRAAQARGARRSTSSAQAGFSPRELAAGAAALDGLVEPAARAARRRPAACSSTWPTTAPTCASCTRGHCVMARTIAIGIEDMPGAAQELQQRAARAPSRASAPPASRRPSAIVLCGAGALGRRRDRLARRRARRSRSSCCGCRRRRVGETRPSAGVRQGRGAGGARRCSAAAASTCAAASSRRSSTRGSCSSTST